MASHTHQTRGLPQIWLRTAALTCLLVGPLCGLVAAGLFLHTLNFIHHAAHTIGTVTSLTPYTDDGQQTSAPVFTFFTPAGTPITKESTLHQNPPPFSIGDKVPVLFDPLNPDHAEIATSGPLYFVPTLLTAFFIVLTSAGALLFWSAPVKNANLPFLSFFLDQ